MEYHSFPTARASVDLRSEAGESAHSDENREVRGLPTRWSRCGDRRPSGFSHPYKIAPHSKPTADPGRSGCLSSATRLATDPSQADRQGKVQEFAASPDWTGLKSADQKRMVRRNDFSAKISRLPAHSQGSSAVSQKYPLGGLTIPYLGTILESWGVCLWFFKKPVDSSIWKERHMGRFRNPRYAPEFLEKRLSPSTLAVGTSSALVGSYSTTTTTTSTTTSTDSPPAPCPEPYIPPAPTGPCGPA
jgi:hypothetical protein